MSFSFAPYPQNRHPPYNYAEPFFDQLETEFLKPDWCPWYTTFQIYIGCNRHDNFIGRYKWGIELGIYSLLYAMTIQNTIWDRWGRGERTPRDHKGSPLIYEDHRGATHTHINRQQGRLNIKRTKTAWLEGTRRTLRWMVQSLFCSSFKRF